MSGLISVKRTPMPGLNVYWSALGQTHATRPFAGNHSDGFSGNENSRTSVVPTGKGLWLSTKSPPPPDAARETFNPAAIRGLVFNGERECHARLIPGLLARPWVAIEQYLIDDEVPGQIAHGLTVNTQEADYFTAFVKVEGFAFVPKA